MKKAMIDTDCGIDDAIAIMMAVRNGIDVKGITTVSGNTAVHQVTDNVLRILHFLGKDDIPVYKGASRPLVKNTVKNSKIHGKNGIGDVKIEKAIHTEESIPAPVAIFEIAKENPGITVITLGPLTNIAMAINLYPELENMIGSIVSMGGALYAGNVTRFAEFNFFFDPEAAQFVFDTSIPLTIVPWDPILKNIIMEEELVKMFPENSKVGKLILSLEQTPMSFMERFYGMRAGVFPDPAAVAYVIDERIAKRKIIGNMEMELNKNSLRGASVLIEGERMEIITEIDTLLFRELLINTTRE